MAIIVLPLIAGTVNLFIIPANAEASAESGNTNYSTLTWNPSSTLETYPRGFSDRGSPIVTYAGGIFGKAANDYAANIVGKASTSSGIQYNSYEGAPGHEMQAGDTFELSYDIAFSDTSVFSTWNQYYFRIRFDGKDLATTDGHAHGYGVNTVTSNPKFFSSDIKTITLQAEKWYNYKVLFTLQADRATLLAEFYIDGVLYKELVLQKSGGGEIKGFSMADFSIAFSGDVISTSLYVDNITLKNYSVSNNSTPGAVKGLYQSISAAISNEAKTFDFSSYPYITAKEFLDLSKGAVLLDASGNEIKDNTPMRYLSLYSANDLNTPYTYLNSVLSTYPETVYDMNSGTGCFAEKNATAAMEYPGGILGKDASDKIFAYTGSGSAVKYAPNVGFSDTKSFSLSFDIALSALDGSGNNVFYMQLQANQEWSGGSLLTSTKNAYGIRVLGNGALYFGDVFTGATLTASTWYNISLSMNRIESNTLRVAIELDGNVVFFEDLQIRDAAAINSFYGVNLFNTSSNTVYLDNVTLRHLNPSETLKMPSISDGAMSAALNNSARTFDFSSNPQITAAEFIAASENMILLDDDGNAVSDETPMRFLNLHAVEYGYPGTKYTYLGIPTGYSRNYFDMETLESGNLPNSTWTLASGSVSSSSEIYKKSGEALSLASGTTVSYLPWINFSEVNEKFEFSFDFAVDTLAKTSDEYYIQVLYNDQWNTNTVGNAYGIRIGWGRLYIFGEDTKIDVDAEKWYSLNISMRLNANDTTKLAVEAKVNGNLVVSKDLTLTNPASISKLAGFKIYNKSSGKLHIDDFDLKHYYASEAKKEIVAELEEITNSIDLIALPDPITNEDKLTLPTVPAGYTVEVNSSSNESIIDKFGNITRGETTERVYITLKVTNTAIAESRITDELLVPVYKTYAVPSISASEIAAAKSEYEKLKYGVFVHYVPSTVYADGSAWGATDSEGNLLDIDTLANSFDAEKFAKDISDAGAEYVVFTAWHALTYPLFPSMTNERWRDDRWESEGAYSKTYSDRDVIADLLDALEPYGISLHLYVHPSEGKDFVDEEQTLTGWNDSSNNYATWNAYTNELMYELGERYGDRIDGLWIDAFFMNISDEETFKLYATANNPKMILNMNVGLEEKYHIEDPMPNHTGADYRAWEFNYQSSLEAVPLTKNQTAIVIGSQWFTDTKQDAEISLNTPEELFRYIVAQGSISTSGGFLASFGCYPNRTQDNLSDIWQTGIKELLLNTNVYISALGDTIIGTIPGIAYPTSAGKTINDLTFVSTESSDGKYVYIHILNGEGNSFTLPAPAEGYNFSTSAKLINSDGSEILVTLTKSSNGEYTLTLPEGIAFDAVDTVLELKRIDSEPPSGEEVSTFVPKFSVSLYSDFGCNIYIPVMDNIVSILIDGNTVDISTLEIKEIDGKNYYHCKKSLSSVNAAESIRLTVSIRLESGKVATGNFDMGIIKYAELVISKSPETYEENLMKDMLAYISAAYTYANKANAASVAERVSAIIGDDYDSAPNTENLNKTPSAPTIAFASMDIGTVPVFIFYPETNEDGSVLYSPENYIFKSGNKTLETEIGENSKGEIYVKVYAYAYGICSDISYTVSGTEIIGSYNIGAYYEAVKSTADLNSDTVLISLIERLWKYSESAKDYRDAVLLK